MNSPSISTNWADFKKWWGTRDDIPDDKTLNYLEHHPMVSSALSVANSIIGVIDISKMKYLYFSPNAIDFIGWQRDEIYKGGVEFIFSRIHPTDQSGLILISEQNNNFFRSLSESHKKQYKAFWDFRVIDPKGIYNKLVQQSCVLKYNAQGAIEELIFFCSMVENIITSESQFCRFSSGTTSSFYRVLHTENKLEALELLSSRELEVAKLIAKSRSLKEVASDLDISFNTVKAHSANILHKLKVKDSIEMVNLLRVFGFI